MAKELGKGIVEGVEAGANALKRALRGKEPKRTAKGLKAEPPKSLAAKPTQPAPSKPKAEKPLAAKPTGGKPAATAPAKPKTEKPFAAKPTGEKPLAAKPTKKAAAPVIKDVRPPRENIDEVIAANTNAGRVTGERIRPIDELIGGVSNAADDQRRVSSLVDAIIGPEGYIERLIVDDAGNVIEGQHRLEALRKLGVTEVPVLEYQDFGRDLSLPDLQSAAFSAQDIHPDQANQIAANLAEIFADEGGNLAEVRQYGAPRGFENAWSAAIDNLEKQTAKPTGGKPAATAPAKPKTEKPLAAKPTKKKAVPVVKGLPNPTQVIAEEYSPEIARRVRDFVDADAGVDQWREVAANLQGTQSNRSYQPENDPAFRDFDLSVYGMRKTIDQPRLFDLDVERQRWSPEQERNMLGFQAIVGRPIMTGMADRTPSGTTITRIGPVELDIPIKEHGGQDYMRDYPHSWGVSTKGMASNFMNTARRLKREFGVNPIWMPWRMQGPGSDFSKTTGETIMSHANSALGLDTRNAMDRFIKENYIPEFAGIGDPRGYLQFGELAGPQRKAMEADLASRFEQEGALSLPITRVLITDPNQLSSKAFHLQNIAEIDPDADVVVKSLNPTYHYNTPGAYEGTLEPEVQENLNVAEVVAPLLRAKYSDLGDLSVFRGQNAPLSPENLADQMARYEDLKAAFDARVAAGDTKAKPPRKPVPIGGTNRFMQSVFATGFLDDKAAQEIYDRMVASGARIK